MVFWGIPGDDELKLVQDAAAKWGLPWDQLYDPKGYEGVLWTQFNVTEQPSIWVFDGEGRIAAKHVQAKQLPEILEKLIQK